MWRGDWLRCARQISGPEHNLIALQVAAVEIRSARSRSPPAGVALPTGYHRSCYESRGLAG